MKRQRMLANYLAVCFIASGITLASSSAISSSLAEYELSGQVNLEHRQFLSAGEQDQEKEQTSVLIKPELYWELDDGDAGFTFTPFYRYDAMDSERTHADIREMLYLTVWDDYEFRGGITKVFWGVTESAHLVDVINQTDSIEAPDGEDKLGQPMLHFSAIKDWGVTEFFLLPYFRERTFSGEDGRLRTAFVVNADESQYESSDEEKHTDFAMRYSQTFGEWDVGVSYLQGTDRDPYFLYQSGEFIPYYAQMKHTGLDIQGFVGDWLLKLEAINRDSEENYTSLITGFEYTWVGAFDGIWDLGFISEFLYDSRGEDSYAIGQRDIFAGIRFAFNDEDSSDLLIGITQDLDNSDVQILKLEGSTRLTNNLSAKLEAWGFENETDTDTLYYLRKDDFVEVAVEYYF